MKPFRMWMAVTANGEPRFGSSGYYLPLNRTADDARHGWGPGFGKPRVIEVEVRAVKPRKARK